MFNGMSLTYRIKSWLGTYYLLTESIPTFHNHIFFCGYMCLRWLHHYKYLVSSLTHWGHVTHICVSNLNIIGWDNGLVPTMPQAIIWTNAVILLIGPPGNFNWKSYIFIQEKAFKNVINKMAGILSQPQCVNIIWISGNNNKFHINSSKPGDALFLSKPCHHWFR